LKRKFGDPENYGFFKNTKEVFEAWEMTREVAKALNSRIIVFQCPASFKPEKENIENFRNFFKKIKGKKFHFCLGTKRELAREFNKRTL